MSAQGQQAAPLQAGDLGPLMELIPEGYPESLQEIAFFIFEGLVSQAPDHNREQLADFAVHATEKLVKEYGEMNLYISKKSLFDMRQKYDGIRRDFRGNNYDELAKKYSVTPARIRQIVNGTR